MNEGNPELTAGEQQPLINQNFGGEVTLSQQHWDSLNKDIQSNEIPKYLPYVFLAIAAICGVGGIISGQFFINAKYDLNYTYNAEQFWALVFQTFLLPISSLFLILFAYHSHKSDHIHLRTKVVLNALIIAVLICLASYIDATVPTDDTLICDVFFCIWIGNIDANDESGFRNVQALIYLSMFWIFIGMFTILVSRTAVEFYHEREIEELEELSFMEHEGKIKKDKSFLRNAGEFLGLLEVEEDEEGGRVVRRARAKRGPLPTAEERAALRAKAKAWRTGLLIFAFLIFYPLLILLCMALPDTFEMFTVVRIREYATYDVPSTWGKVWNYYLGDKLILKLYPDIIAFYLFIYAIAIVGLVAQAVPSVRKFFHSYPKWLGGLTVGDVLLGISFGGLLVSEFCYWYYTHGWEEQKVTSVSRLERFARAVGQVANACCGILVLPVARNSIWAHTFGVSWEAMIKFHRFAGGTMVVLVLIHVISWFSFYAVNNLRLFVIPQDYHADNFTIQLSLVSTFFMMIAMGVLTFERIRRNHFEVFYYAHHIFVVVFGVMLYHAAMSWYFMLGGLSLYMLDRAIRFARGTATTKCIGVEVVGDVTKISYVIESKTTMFWGGKLSKMKHQMGQYCFINLPAISVLEWHPFTISSAPSDLVLTHHIENMGPGTFTDKLQKLAMTLPWNELDTDLLINVDGPYGIPVDFEQYDQVVLVGGGIGITPINSCLRELYGLGSSGQLEKVQRVHLVWVAKDPALFAILSSTFSEIDENSLEGKFSYSLYATQRAAEEGYDAAGLSSYKPKVAIAEGRPNLQNEMTLSKEGESSSTSSIVFACGPSSLIEESKSIARDFKFDFHYETFLL